MGGYLSLGAGLVGGGLLLTRHLQRSIVFMPPGSHMLYRNAILNASPKGHQIYNSYNGISYRTVQGKGKDIIIYSHGNAEDLCSCDIVEMSRTLECTVIAYDYPGYGNSDGTPSEASCIEALGKIVEHVQNTYPDGRIILCGRSLGTGVTVQYAHKTHWRNPIILISPFKSIGRVLCDSCVPDTISGMFQSWDVISKLWCPVKIIHGIYDNIVPVAHGKELYSALRNPLRPVWKPYDHNDIILDRDDFVEVLESAIHT